MRRREFLTSSLMAGAGFALAATHTASASHPHSINVFSKSLQWLDYAGMANTAAEIGFEGIDLTVRPNGHVKPERVGDDLPRAVEAIRKAGLEVPMITTAILSAEDPLTESILKTASKLGVVSYRMGWMQYNEKISIDENLNKFEAEFSKLNSLNKKYNIRGEYQNHSGAYFGSAVWDIAPIVKKFEPATMGLQYDILHATVEGANAWPIALRQVASHVTSLPIKDFQWNNKDGKALMKVVPLGEGTIDFKKFFHLIKELGIHGPFSMHFEYPLGGAEDGATSLKVAAKDVVASMKNDLAKFRAMLKEHGVRN